ncbi:hypothetical protein FSARC_14421 [Fusarium sarcochroum]|uniref:Protein kinase domain-containing protein n=1 Tax=Fusarium sarcochroum TaxID=1208366 RepID=A0A8H4STJ1_9HYPO|nr:hypothetical protein FSARC_14421 [Fusarium sarcochroum]
MVCSLPSIRRIRLWFKPVSLKKSLPQIILKYQVVPSILLRNLFMASESSNKACSLGSSARYMSSGQAIWSSGSQHVDLSSIVKDSLGSIASTKPFVDYDSLVRYVSDADIEIVPITKLQITGIKLGAGAYMTVYRGSCIERFGERSLAIKMIDIPLPRGNSELPQFTDEWMHQLAIVSLEVRVLSNGLLRTHPNIVRLLGISFLEVCDPTNNTSNVEFLKPILLLEEAHQEYPTLERFYEFAKARGQTISTDTKVALWSGVADALSAVHIAGVVHGDVKPANVLIFENPSTGELVAKLSDFGGCHAEDDSDVTTQFELLGTEYWNAPEAYDSDHTQHRSKFRDIYSFGLLGFYILFESYPFGDPGPRSSHQNEALRLFKSDWKALSSYVITRLRRLWPHVMTKEALEHLRSLPRVTDHDSMMARLIAYRDLVQTGDIEIGVRTAPSTTTGLFGIRISKKLDYRPFTMTLAMTLFIHNKTETRDLHGLLGSLPIFLNEENTAMRLSYFCGSEGWQYMLEQIVENTLTPWQLGSQARDVPESLRRILIAEYEERLDNSTSNERIRCLEALGSLNVDNYRKFISYNFQAAQIGSMAARAFLAKIGPGHAANPNEWLQEIARWKLETALSGMPQLDTFQSQLEETCPSLLKVEEILTPLTYSPKDFHLMNERDHDCSLWIFDLTQPPPQPAMSALQAIVGNDNSGLHQAVKNDTSVLNERFGDGDTLLHVAAELDRTKMLVTLVNEYGMDVDLQNSDFITPLVTAAVHDCHDALDVLLNLRAEYKRLLSGRVTSYLANISRNGMIRRLIELFDGLKQEWPVLSGMNRPCPSIAELLDGSFSFYDDQIPETEPSFTPIFAAILGNNLSSLEELLRFGCSHDVWAKFTAPSQVRLAPIHLACQLRPLHLAILLHYGADVNLETADELRQSPIHFVCTATKQPSYDYPRSRLDSGNPSISLPVISSLRLCMLQLLVRYGLTNFDARDALGKTALHHCVQLQGCLPVIQALIQDFQADLQIQDVALCTPLHLCVATAEQDQAYLDILLSNMSIHDIDTLNIQLVTPLMLAVSRQRGKHSINICKCLILRGSLLHLQSRSGETILHLAIHEPGDYELFLYLYQEIGKIDLLLALSRLVDVHGRTFVHGMARSKSLRIRHHLRYLPSEILRELINQPDLDGFTLLHEAILADDPELVRFLLENGADVDQPTIYDASPLCIALGSGHFKVVELLEQRAGLASTDRDTLAHGHYAKAIGKREEREDTRTQNVSKQVIADIEGRRQTLLATRSQDDAKQDPCRGVRVA